MLAAALDAAALFAATLDAAALDAATLDAAALDAAALDAAALDAAAPASPWAAGRDRRPRAHHAFVTDIGAFNAMGRLILDGPQLVSLCCRNDLSIRCARPTDADEAGRNELLPHHVCKHGHP